MKIGRLILLGAFVFGAAASAEAATTAPRLAGAKPATLVTLKTKDKKTVHAHKASKTKKVKKDKKS